MLELLFPIFKTPTEFPLPFTEIFLGKSLSPIPNISQVGLIPNLLHNPYINSKPGLDYPFI